MNLQQLEYVVAVDKHRHFVTAAEQCFVTQATLSMMIKKLESELGVQIFDRSRQPVIPTSIGEAIILQAKQILFESNKLKELIQTNTSTIAGEIRLAIIPTLAPYLLPLFLSNLLKAYPLIRLTIFENTTSQIIKKLENEEIDLGILALPVHNQKLVEIPLFTEDFVLYSSIMNDQNLNDHIDPSEIEIEKLWLLEEGHCLRDQVINLCGLKKDEKLLKRIDFAAGSIETLKSMVEINQGLTILPKLALHNFNKEQLKQIKYFNNPIPNREIGIVHNRYYTKTTLITVLKEFIIESVKNLT